MGRPGRWPDGGQRSRTRARGAAAPPACCWAVTLLCVPVIQGFRPPVWSPALCNLSVRPNISRTPILWPCHQTPWTWLPDSTFFRTARNARDPTEWQLAPRTQSLLRQAPVRPWGGGPAPSPALGQGLLAGAKCSASPVIPPFMAPGDGV